MSSGVGLRHDWRSNASSSILACYLVGQSRHQSRSSPAAKRAARHRWSARPSALTFELLVPRLLLSADVFLAPKPDELPHDSSPTLELC
jgi:hypothetical protein